jgi:hypothetical protein
LAGFEIHQIRRVEGAALANSAIALIEHRDVNSETAARLLGTRETLKKDVDWSAELERAYLSRDVTEQAVLRRHAGAIYNFSGEIEQPLEIGGFIDARIDADQRVATSLREALVDRCGDRLGIIPRMIWLQASREASTQTDSRARPGDHAKLRADRYQVEVG